MKTSSRAAAAAALEKGRRNNNNRVERKKTNPENLTHSTIYIQPLRSTNSYQASTPQLSKKQRPKMVRNGNGSKLLEILNVRVIGTGNKVLVLSHGFGTDQSVWNKIVPFLLRDHRIVLYDLACAGSVNPDHFDFNRYTTLDAYVDDLLTILDALCIERCSLIAHSFSAMVGVLASIRRPELFQKLILIGFSPCFLNDKGYCGGFERGEIIKVLEAMKTNYEAWVCGFAPLAVGADVPAAVREFSITLFNMRPDISLFVSKMVFESDLRGVLKAVRVPCWVIQTSKDVSVPVSVADYLKSQLGGRTTVEILSNTEGHLPHLSTPQILAPVLRRALASSR